MTEYICDEFQKEHEIRIRNIEDTKPFERVKEVTTHARVTFFTRKDVDEVDFDLPYIIADASGPKHLKYTLTRKKFQSLIDDIRKRDKMEKLYQDKK